MGFSSAGFFAIHQNGRNTFLLLEALLQDLPEVKQER